VCGVVISISRLIIVIYFSCYCSILGVIGGLIIGAISGTITSLKQESKIRLHPNQGIWNSFKVHFWTTTILFSLTILLKVISPVQQYLLGLLAILIMCFSVGGGKACLQHLSLRIVMWQSGLPWNFARFLNYCVERRLLLRVGGSYRFLHRELLDHFAQSSR
jgi:hypothetical protein